MRISEQSHIREIREKALRLYRIRFFSVLALLPAYYAISKIAGFESQVGALTVLGLLEIVFNFPFPLYFKTSEKAFKYLAASLMVDFMAETLAVHFIGGVDAMFFTAMYLLSILYCAVNLPAILTFLMATLASFLYAGLIAGEYFEVFSHRATLGLTLNGMQQAAYVVSHVAFFYLIAFVATYLAKALIEKERRLASFVEELRDANQRIKYAHRMKSEFIAHLSHEIRTPLHAILGLGNLLKETEIGPLNAKQLEYVVRVEESGKHLLEIVNDVLDISKLEARKVQMDWAEVDLTEVIGTSVDLFYEEAMRKNIRLNFTNKRESGLRVSADLRKLRQILYNLLSNAVKYTTGGGEVKISWEKKPGFIELTVADNGIGIAKEDLSCLFNPYEQPNRKRPPEVSGTGLGLAITKQFVEMHGGAIRVESEPGRGSRFIVSLPHGVHHIIPPVPNPQVRAA